MTSKPILVVLLTAFSAFLMPIKAQFHTITDRRNIQYEYLNVPKQTTQESELKEDTIANQIIDNDLAVSMEFEKSDTEKTSKQPLRKKHLDYNHRFEGMPDLTINNLLREIRKNHILYEKVVLAQAILETGWFTSSVCRNKNNLFGLTNPRTGEYYEFNHWTESVRAYYTKVQYKYKGGNYLLWLDQLPYATKTTYIESLIQILKQYFI